jgi:hypothetical protein
MIEREREKKRTRSDDVPQGFSVRRELGDGLAEVERLAGPVVNDESQVVRGDGASDGVSASFDLSPTNRKGRHIGRVRVSTGRGCVYLPRTKRSR